MDRHYDRAFSNGDYDAPRSHRRRGSFESERRTSRTEYPDDVYRTIRITNINPRVSDKDVADVVYREFRDFGDYNVKVTYYGDQRLCFVNFQYPEDASAAMRELYNRLILFDMPVRLGPVYPRPPPPRGGGFGDRGLSPPPRRSYEEPEFSRSREHLPPPRSDFVEKLPPPPRDNILTRIRHLMPEDDGFACRTLFVGNVDPDIPVDELRAVFERYGYVEDVDIKKPVGGSGSGNPYAFVRYFNLNMAHAAKVKLSGKFIGPYQCKIGYGKPTPTNCVWVGNLGPWVSKRSLEHEFDRFGSVQRTVWPEGRDFAYITYNNVESAKDAVLKMRGFRLKGADKLLRTDFVEPKHAESELNYKPFRRSRSRLSSEGRSRSRRFSRSRSFSGSASPGSRSGSSAGSMKGKRRKHKSKDGRQSKRERSRDDRNSSGPTQSRPVKKRKHRSPSFSSNSSSHGNAPPRSLKYVTSQNENGSGQLKTISDLARSSPVVWSSNLSLKNSAFFVDMHLISGSQSIVSSLMFDSKQVKFTNLKLTQRLRLDPSKLDEVRRRIHMAGDDWCVLLAVASTTGCLEGGLEAGLQERPLKNLVSYLRQKEAAGVVYLPPNSGHGQETGLLHTFAPCEFAHGYLKQRAPKLQVDLDADDYVIVILVRVNI